QNYIESEHEAEWELIKANITPQIIRYVGSVGCIPSNLNGMDIILKKDTQSEEDIASLVMHYVDNHTINSEWSTDTETLPNGNRINDLNRRIEKDRQNPKYQKINEEGKEYFEGKTSYEMLESVVEAIELYLVKMIKEKTGQNIDPKD